MSRAEQRRITSVLDDRPMYEWILNARILPMGDGSEGDSEIAGQNGGGDDGLAQTAKLETPQFVFGRGFGRPSHPDEGLLAPRSPESNSKSQRDNASRSESGSNRAPGDGVATGAPGASLDIGPSRQGGLKHQRSPTASGPSTSSTVNTGPENGDAQNGISSDAEAAPPPPKKRRVRIVWADEEAA